MKMYFKNDDDEFCYPLSYWKQYLIDTNDDKIELYTAKKNEDKDWFYCKFYQEVGVKSESSCGSLCEGYQPRNGVKGCCKHYSPTYESGDKCILIRNGKRFKLIKQTK